MRSKVEGELRSGVDVDEKSKERRKRFPRQWRRSDREREQRDSLGLGSRKGDGEGTRALRRE